MKLKKIIDNLTGIVKVEGRANFEISGIACDSKAVKPGYLFAALKGSKVNGADFIDEAIERGASAILLDAGDEGIFKRGGAFIYVKDSKLALAQACQAYFGDISGKMRIVGVTGTNGKTTITYLLESLFKSIGEEAGVIGTVNYRFGQRLIPAVNTTPEALELYSLLSGMRKEKIKNCVMEVSSHSLALGRVDTLKFDAAIFTNLTREHLDFHKDMEDYLNAKLKLFEKIKKSGFAIINTDDPSAAKVMEKVKSYGKAKIITYAIDREADIRAEDIDLSCKGSGFRIEIKKEIASLVSLARNDTSLRHCEAQPDVVIARPKAEAISINIESSLIGRHNVYNILAASGAGLSMGISLADIKKGVDAMKGLPGRLESVACGQNFSVYVDYAHTEDGLENVLKSLRELKPGKLISVFGCGGNRDRFKRPGMGRISTELSDTVFITSDNPRNEEPMDIINEITKGIDSKKDNYAVEPDRFIAIKKALAGAHAGDIVLVAGKGHETYQIFKDTTIPFDDREVVKRILIENMTYGARSAT